MTKAEEDEYKQRLELLKTSMAEQSKELIAPVAIDLASALAGWYIGKKIGRASLLAGLLTYGFGKFHSLHETVNREEQRLKDYDADNRPALSGLHPLYYNEERVYHGESPAVALGFGLMLGGAFSQVTLNGPEREQNPFSDIADDLKYRLYLDRFFTAQENKSAEEKNLMGAVDELDVFLAKDKMLEGPESVKLDELDRANEQAAILFDAEGKQIETKQEKQLRGGGAQEDDLGEISESHIL